MNEPYKLIKNHKINKTTPTLSYDFYQRSDKTIFLFSLVTNTMLMFTNKRIT